MHTDRLLAQSEVLFGVGAPYPDIQNLCLQRRTRLSNHWQRGCLMRIEEAGCSIVIVPPFAWITNARRAILQGRDMMLGPCHACACASHDVMADGFHDMHELTMHLDATMFEAVTPLTETSPSGRQNDRFVLFREIRTQELQTMPKNTATELRDLRMASKSNLDRMHAHTRHGK